MRGTYCSCDDLLSSKGAMTRNQDTNMLNGSQSQRTASFVCTTPSYMNTLHCRSSTFLVIKPSFARSTFTTPR